METITTKGFARPQTAEPVAQQPPRSMPTWVEGCAVAVVVALLVFAVWPTGATGGMSADEFQQMYEGAPAVDAACPQCSFP